jgi:hypothetical protein
LVEAFGHTSKNKVEKERNKRSICSTISEKYVGEIIMKFATWICALFGVNNLRNIDSGGGKSEFPLYFVFERYNCSINMRRNPTVLF